MDSTIDLLEHYETLPEEVQAILDSWDDNEELYSECERLLQELAVHGYTADYGLDGQLVDLKRISECDIDDQCYLEDWIVQDSGLSSNHGTVTGFEKEEQPYKVDGEYLYNWYAHIKMHDGEDATVNAHEIKKLY
jgi:hypothetical protein